MSTGVQFHIAARSLINYDQFMRKLIQTFFKFFINLYPPFLGAGVHLKTMSKDFRYARVEMPLRFYNRNYVGTQFGGSLYAMTDPWFMFMLMENLGDDYIVWDKAATIRFKKPGRKRVIAEFHMKEEELNEIRSALQSSQKFEKTFTASVFDTDGVLVAEVEKLLYVRRK